MLEDDGYHLLQPLDTQDGFLSWAGSGSEVQKLFDSVHPEFVEHELKMICSRKSFPDVNPFTPIVNPIIPIVHWSTFDHLLVRSHDEELYEREYEGSVEGSSTPRLHNDGSLLLSDLCDEEMFEVDPQVFHRDNADVSSKHFLLCDALECERSEDRVLEKYKESNVLEMQCDPSQSSGESGDGDELCISEDVPLSNGCHITAGIMDMATGEIICERDAVFIKEWDDQGERSEGHDFQSEGLGKAQEMMIENLEMQLPLKSSKLCTAQLLLQSDVLTAEENEDEDPAWPKMAEGRIKIKQKSSKSRKQSVLSKQGRVARAGCCPICNTERKRLDRHILIHTGSKPYMCPTCKRQFRQSEHLKRHLNKHIQSPSKFQCEGCSQWLTRKDKLKEHQKLCKKWKELGVMRPHLKTVPSS